MNELTDREKKIQAVINDENITFKLAVINKLLQPEEITLPEKGRLIELETKYGFYVCGY